MVIWIDGRNIDIERLKAAWALIIQHHPMLRVKYTEDGQQQILKESPFTTIDVHDFTTCPQVEISKKLETIRANTSHRLLAIDQGEVACLLTYSYLYYQMVKLVSISI